MYLRTANTRCDLNRDQKRLPLALQMALLFGAQALGGNEAPAEQQTRGIGAFVTEHRSAIHLVLMVVGMLWMFAFATGDASASETFPVMVGGLVALPATAPGEIVVDRPGPGPLYSVTNIQNFDGMTTRDYLKYFKDGIKNARDHTRYDTNYWAPNTTIAAGTYEFFGEKPGGERVSLDGGTAITLTDYHTNMQEGGKIEKGASLIIDSLQIEVHIPHREFNAFSADLTPSSAVVTGTDTSSATAHMLALDKACIFELWRGQKLLAEGSLSDFPAKGGFYSSFGGSTPEGHIQNGFGQANYLREVVVLDAGYIFKLKMRVLTGILSVLNVEIRPKLCGVLIETVG